MSGGHPGSGDGASMPSPPPDPSGSPPAGDVSDASAWPPPGYIESDRYPATEWLKAQLREARTTLDPVRDAALGRAVELLRFPFPPDGEEGPDLLARVIAAANMFAAWLQGPEEFDRWLADDGSTEQIPVDPHWFFNRHSTLDTAPCLFEIGPSQWCGRRRDDPVHQEAP